MSWKAGPIGLVVSGTVAGVITSSVLYLNVIAPVSGTLLLPLLPIPMLRCGFVAGINGVLIALMVMIATMAAFFSIEEAMYFLFGMALPIAILVGFHDGNLMGKRAANDPMPLRKISRERLGYCLCALPLLHASGLLIMDGLLSVMELETLAETLGRQLDVTGLTPQEVQQTQAGANVMKVAPAAIVVTILIWVLLNARLVAWRARKRERTDVDLKFGGAAIPVWYTGLAAVAAVVASQTSGPIGFLAVNTALIMALPGLMVGFGFIHEMTTSFRRGWIILLLLYGLIAITVQIGSLFLIVLIGFLDTPLGLRRWMKAKLKAKLEVKNA